MKWGGFEGTPKQTRFWRVFLGAVISTCKRPRTSCEPASGVRGSWFGRTESNEGVNPKATTMGKKLDNYVGFRFWVRALVRGAGRRLPIPFPSLSRRSPRYFGLPIIWSQMKRSKRGKHGKCVSSWASL